MRSFPIRFLVAVCALLCGSLAGCHKTPPPGVALTWEAPPGGTGVSIAGYNVYRSTTAGGQFVKLASRVPGPPYEDRMVVSGRTYFYVVTAVDQTGRESVYSGKARATVP
jgi:titin